MYEVNCRRCNEETNYPPDDMPTEYRGLCPNCVVALSEAGELPMPTPEAMLNYIAQAVTNRILGALPDGVEIHVIELGGTKSPSEVIVTPGGPIQYSQN